MLEIGEHHPNKDLRRLVDCNPVVDVAKITRDQNRISRKKNDQKRKNSQNTNHEKESWKRNSKTRTSLEKWERSGL